jgi:hypothetical protein
MFRVVCRSTADTRFVTPGGFCGIGRQGPWTVPEPKSRKAAHLSVERRAIRVHVACYVFSVCRASSASTAALVKPKISANMIVRNIDKAPTILIPDAVQTGMTKRHIL